MYAVIKYRNYENVTYMEMLHTTCKLKTAINIAYTYAKQSFEDIINYHQTKETFIFPCITLYTENDKKPESFIYAVTEIPELEKMEDTEYKYTPEELFGEDFDGEEFELFCEESEYSESEKSDSVVSEDHSSEEELNDLDELFGEFVDYGESEESASEESEYESDEMEDVLYSNYSLCCN